MTTAHGPRALEKRGLELRETVLHPVPTERS